MAPFIEYTEIGTMKKVKKVNNERKILSHSTGELGGSVRAVDEPVVAAGLAGFSMTVATLSKVTARVSASCFSTVLEL